MQEIERELPVYLISIHALVQRATLALYVITQILGVDFNPRSRAESDDLPADQFNQLVEFQSTLSCRERLIYGFYLTGYLLISIHALVQRATIQPPKLLMSFHISIHALVQRATNSSLNNYTTSKISIHALVQRATVSVLLLGL